MGFTHESRVSIIRPQPLLMLFFIAFPMLAQAQFTLQTNFGSITVVSYKGGGAVVIPSNTNGFSVTSIGIKCFYTNTTLTSISIPATITNIGLSAFESCIQLTNVIGAKGVTFIDLQAFYNCLGLGEIIIPSNVTYIGQYAFAESGLRSVTIPNGVARIDTGTFNNCQHLTNVVIPPSVITLGTDAFGSCLSLKQMTLPSSILGIFDNAFTYNPNTLGLYFCGNAPAISSTAFYNPYYQTTATLYYLPGTSGWTSTFTGANAVEWNPAALVTNASGDVASNPFTLSITGNSNMMVRVQACTNLANPTWIPLITLTLTNGSSYFTDLQWTNYPARFYGFGFPD